MIKELSYPLDKEDIELRIGTCTEKGFSLLLYKTARTDINRLNNVCGLDWKNEHFYDKENNLCCRISVYDKDKKEWVTREDVGTESNTEKEKGSYSDSFKRAGYRFGIGIELYTSPLVWICGNVEKVEDKKNKGEFKFFPALKTYNMSVSKYKVESNRIVELQIKHSGKIIFDFHNQKEEEKVTKEQIMELEALGTNFKALCRNFNVKSPDELTKKQAEEALKIKRERNKSSNVQQGQS